MLIEFAKWIIVLFGVFILIIGFMMLFAPKRALGILKKAGSSPFINYAEITIRMIPAAALVIYSNFTLFPKFLSLVGWFMLATSLVLYFIPIKAHHNFALKSASLLKPQYVRFLSLPAFLFGGFLLYSLF